MSGHSKWSKIKRKKGAADAKRSKIFAKIIKEIVIAVREGGGPDPAMNPRLRMAIMNAKGVNMPKENVERNIKKASETDGAQFTEVVYEGVGPGGIAFLVECTTDNANRSVANIRHAFMKAGGSLGTSGSADYIFDHKGVFLIPAEGLDEDDFTLEVIDAGAEDVDNHDGYLIITTEKDDFGNMMKQLEKMNITPENASLQHIPKITTDKALEVGKKVLGLVDVLEDDDDVNAVYHNMTITDELIESEA